MLYYQRHLGDYAKDASHLSMLEHGAYSLLLDRYYATEKPIPANEVYRVTKASSRAEKAAIDCVLKEFFTLTDDGWTNNRAEEELAKMREKTSKASKSAKARWDANAMRTHSERNANAMLTNNQYPITNRDSIETLSLTPNVGRKGPVPVSRFLKGVMNDD
jgi:uncharacterized protein YdaU (DUF1376 family)